MDLQGFIWELTTTGQENSPTHTLTILHTVFAWIKQMTNNMVISELKRCQWGDFMSLNQNQLFPLFPVFMLS